MYLFIPRLVSKSPMYGCFASTKEKSLLDGAEIDVGEIACMRDMSMYSISGMFIFVRCYGYTQNNY
jgi:hypothetical protein